MAARAKKKLLAKRFADARQAAIKKASLVFCFSNHLVVNIAAPGHPIIFWMLNGNIYLLQ